MVTKTKASGSGHRDGALALIWVNPLGERTVEHRDGLPDALDDEIQVQAALYGTLQDQIDVLREQQAEAKRRIELAMDGMNDDAKRLVTIEGWGFKIQRVEKSSSPRYDARKLDALMIDNPALATLLKPLRKMSHRSAHLRVSRVASDE